MRNFGKWIKGRGLFQALFLLLVGGGVPFSVLSGEATGVSGRTAGYNSRDAGLEEPGNGRKERVYTLDQLENLHYAVQPVPVKVLDWSDGDYQSSLKKGILVTREAYRAKRVSIAGNFNNWRPHSMKRGNRGVYYYIIPFRKMEGGKLARKYAYKFLVDGIWESDPVNKNRVSDGLGDYLSVFRLRVVDVDHQITIHRIKEVRPTEERLVEFAIYLPDVENLSLVGNFNNWNPEHDFLMKGDDGIFRLRKKLPPGKYLYKYVADGKWILDTYNPDTRYYQDIGELCSYYVVEED